MCCSGRTEDGCGGRDPHCHGCPAASSRGEGDRAGRSSRADGTAETEDLGSTARRV